MYPPINCFIWKSSELREGQQCWVLRARKKVELDSIVLSITYLQS